MKLLNFTQSLIAMALMLAYVAVRQVLSLFNSRAYASMLLSPGVSQVPPVSINGANEDIAGAIAQTAALALNSQSAAGGWNINTISASTATLTNLGNLFQSLTNGGATTVTLDSAYNICNTLPQPLTVGQKFGFQIQTVASCTVATPTLLATDVTLAGTTSMLASALRFYQGVVTQVTSTVGCPLTVGSTYTSITQIGSSNLFTVALGTNALVPVVGTLIYLGVTAGTLPPGWYPIVKVTSATSFVIATPLGQVWTCTAATLNATGGGQVAPATYAPLVTITGLMTVGASMAV